MESLKKLDYADLNDTQERRLKELESNFNAEFGTKYYFMAMDKNLE